jgi:uncharacterized protein
LTDAPTDQPPVLLIAFAVCIWLAGLVLLYRLATGRLGTSSPGVPAWPLSIEKFIISGLLVFAGGIIFPQLTTYLSHDILGPATTDGDWWMIVQGASFQIGMLCGALLASVLFHARPVDSSGPVGSVPPKPKPILAGLITFLIAIPLIDGVGYLWKTIIEFFGYSASEQDMVDLFRNADDPYLLVWMIVLAAIVAPITEELIFRAGLFRYLRTRIPRALALILPALLFALLHGNLAAFTPLCALGVFFALAYERTGSIAVPMIAHALFNLHTIVRVMAGITG